VTSEIERIGYCVRLCMKSDKLHLHRALHEGDLKRKGVWTSTDWPTPGSRAFLEKNSPSAGHEIRCFVCNLQSHYRVHMTTTMVPIPRQIYPVHITTYFGNINFSIIFQFTYYWHSMGTSQYSRVCYMPCQSHTLFLAKYSYLGFLITQIYSASYLEDLTERSLISCSPAASI